MGQLGGQKRAGVRLGAWGGLLQSKLAVGNQHFRVLQHGLQQGEECFVVTAVAAAARAAATASSTTPHTQCTVHEPNQPRLTPPHQPPCPPPKPQPQSFEMDNTWLDRLDMGFDFADDMLADLPINTTDGLVPSISDDAGMVPGAGLPTTPTAAAIEQQLAEPTPKSLAAAVPQQQLQQDALQAPLLATLERQSTDEFFASLADDFAVPSMAAHELPSTVPAMMHVPSAAPQQPAMVPMVPQQQATFYPQQAAMYMAPQPAVVPQLVPIPLPAPSAAATPAPSALTQPPLPKRQRRAVFEDSDEDEDDDDEEWRHDEEFAGAPSSRAASRAGAASASSAAAAAAAAAAPIDNLTREQRVARYREKRKNRQFKKTIRYASRKAYAEVRPRIKGRFAKKEELEAWRAAERAMAAGAAAAGMALPEGFGFAFGEAPGVVPVM